MAASPRGGRGNGRTAGARAAPRGARVGSEGAGREGIAAHGGWRGADVALRGPPCARPAGALAGAGCSGAQNQLNRARHQGRELLGGVAAGAATGTGDGVAGCAGAEGARGEGRTPAATSRIRASRRHRRRSMPAAMAACRRDWAAASAAIVARRSPRATAKPAAGAGAARGGWAQSGAGWIVSAI